MTEEHVEFVVHRGRAIWRRIIPVTSSSGDGEFSCLSPIWSWLDMVEKRIASAMYSREQEQPEEQTEEEQTDGSVVAYRH